MRKNKTHLDRFIDAQRDGKSACGIPFEQALAEIQAGKKITHWIWYVFPQLRGLGQSTLSYLYGIQDLEEAKSYLRNRILRNNLRLIVRALLKHSGVPILQIFGTVDAFKVHSCVTLFLRAAMTQIDRRLFQRVIDEFFNGEEDLLTLSRLGFVNYTVNGKPVTI